MADTESESTKSDSVEEQHAVSDLRRAMLAATEQSPVGTVVTDLEGRIEYASPSFEELTGYSADELVGTSISALEDRSSVSSVDLWAAIKGGRVWRGEFEMDRKDGSSFWGSVMIFPVHDESGSVTHFVGLDQDITERKMAEDSLRESRERYRAIVGALPDMMFRIDIEGRYTDFTPAKGTEPFVPPGELLGKTAAEVLPPDVAELIEIGLEEAIKTGETQTIEYQLGEGESRRDFEGRIVSLAGGEALIVVRDLTERRRAEEELVRSRALVRTVTESTAAAAFIYRRSGLAYANPAAVEMTGYAREELMNMNFLDIVHHDHRELIGERMRARFEGRPQPSRYEFKMTRENGDDLWVDCVIGGVIDFEGLPAIVGTAIDVTERKRDEEALRSAREDLERRTEQVSKPASAYGLTFRELTVLSVMAEGKQDREIAELLGISHRTVQAHVASILKKMKARTRTDASVRAQKEGLIG